MAPAVVPASPALRAAVIQCVNQPAASLEVQQAAIQVFRLTSVPHEASNFISRFQTFKERISLYAYKRVLFAHRAEMLSCGCFWTVPAPCKSALPHTLYSWRTPSPLNWPSWLLSYQRRRINKSGASWCPTLSTFCPQLSQRQQSMLKTLVAAYLFSKLWLSGVSCFTAQCNFIFSPPRLRQMIRDAMQDNKIGNIMDPTKFSRNYKMGSVEGNVIFEGNSYLPKEAMLEMTLRAFGYDIDMMEVNIFIVSSLSCVLIYFLEVATLKKNLCHLNRLAWRAQDLSPQWKPCLERTDSSPTLPWRQCTLCQKTCRSQSARSCRKSCLLWGGIGWGYTEQFLLSK